MSVTSQNFAALDNMSGLQTIDDSAAEMVMGGFRVMLIDDENRVVANRAADNFVAVAGNDLVTIDIDENAGGDVFRIDLTNGGNTRSLNFEANDDNLGVLEVPAAFGFGNTQVDVTRIPTSPMSASGNPNGNGNGRCEPGEVRENGFTAGLIGGGPSVLCSSVFP